MLKILVADDHTIVREGLKQILGEVPEMIVAGEASDGLEALRKVRQDHYDLVLLDIAMPGIGGLDVLKHLKSEKPDLPVLMLSMYPEEQYAVRTLKAGASGYLTKESASDELIAAIRKVSSGGKYVTSSLAEKLASCLDTYSERPVHEKLSDREYQVVRMIASGKTVTEIAEELSLSVKTISTNRSRALTKMGMKTNAELTYYAIKHGLVE
ncbi:MAG: response regulator transcription factor [Phycisphaerales bacterium]|nr:MAG: response regulator transcription factor [Phycisphaerales bacterium]